MRFDSSNIPAEFSFEKEKEVARKFAQRFQWEMMLIGIVTSSFEFFTKSTANHSLRKLAPSLTLF